MVEHAEGEGGMRLATLATQQGIGTIEQAHVATGANQLTVNRIAVVVGHRGVEAQLHARTVVVSLQLATSQVDGGRLGRRHHLGLVDTRIAQPQLVAILGRRQEMLEGTGRQTILTIQVGTDGIVLPGIAHAHGLGHLGAHLHPIALGVRLGIDEAAIGTCQLKLADVGRAQRLVEDEAYRAALDIGTEQLRRQHDGFATHQLVHAEAYPLGHLPFAQGMDVDGLAQVDSHGQLGMGVVGRHQALGLAQLWPPTLLRLVGRFHVVGQLHDAERHRGVVP